MLLRRPKGSRILQSNRSDASLVDSTQHQPLALGRQASGVGIGVRSIAETSAAGGDGPAVFQKSKASIIDLPVLITIPAPRDLMGKKRKILQRRLMTHRPYLPRLEASIAWDRIDPSQGHQAQIAAEKIGKGVHRSRDAMTIHELKCRAFSLQSF